MKEASAGSDDDICISIPIYEIYVKVEEVC